MNIYRFQNIQKVTGTSFVFRQNNTLSTYKQILSHQIKI